MAIINIKIIGTVETSKAMKMITKEFNDMTEPLTISSKRYLNVISANFIDEGKTFNKAWPPLSEATIAIKRALHKQGKSIGVKKPLLRTGKLRKSFKYEMKGTKQTAIFNAVDYALIHQEGGEVFFKGKMRKVPRRILAAVDSKRVQMVGSIFKEWINKSIKKYMKTKT